MNKIIGMLWDSPRPQIGWRSAHVPPVLDETLDAQRAVRQFAIPDGRVLSLPYEINVAISKGPMSESLAVTKRFADCGYVDPEAPFLNGYVRPDVIHQLR